MSSDQIDPNKDDNSKTWQGWTKGQKSEDISYDVLDAILIRGGG